jgi:hypothetical protein
MLGSPIRPEVHDRSSMLIQGTPYSILHYLERINDPNQIVPMVGSRTTRSKTTATYHNTSSWTLHNVEITLEPILTLVPAENTNP